MDLFGILIYSIIVTSPTTLTASACVGTPRYHEQVIKEVIFPDNKKLIIRGTYCQEA